MEGRRGTQMEPVRRVPAGSRGGQVFRGTQEGEGILPRSAGPRGAPGDPGVSGRQGSGQAGRNRPVGRRRRGGRNSAHPRQVREPAGEDGRPAGCADGPERLAGRSREGGKRPAAVPRRPPLLLRDAAALGAARIGGETMTGPGTVKKKLRGAAGFAPWLLLLAGFAPLSGGCGDGARHETGEIHRPPVADVEVVTASPLQQETMVEAVGTIRARNVAVVASQVMGRLISFPVSEGSRVEKGAILATIEDTAIRAQAEAAEGTAAEALAARNEAEGAVAQAEAGKTLAG